jgi:endonuclease III
VIRVFQEALRGEPFWLIVGCSLVNRASWKVAGPIHARVRLVWPDPPSLAAAGPDLETVLAPLGFGSRRGALLRRLAAAWAARPARSASDVLSLPGCGPYASDSYSIFVEGRRPEREPSDHYLRVYLERNVVSAPRGILI